MNLWDTPLALVIVGILLIVFGIKILSLRMFTNPKGLWGFAFLIVALALFGAGEIAFFLGVFRIIGWI